MEILSCLRAFTFAIESMTDDNFSLLMFLDNDSFIVHMKMAGRSSSTLFNVLFESSLYS